MHELVKACANHCPDAHLLVISNPVNSTVPIVCQTFNSNRVWGITTLDAVRAATFLQEARPTQIPSASSVPVPVVGGHSRATIVPLWSQATLVGTHNVLKLELTEQEEKALTHRVQIWWL